jgi:hypothetical protein
MLLLLFISPKFKNLSFKIFKKLIAAMWAYPILQKSLKLSYLG